MKYISDFTNDATVRENFQDFKLLMRNETLTAEQYIDEGVYSNPDYARQDLAGRYVIDDMLAAIDTMVADAREFGDKYMRGDCSSDKFLFARMAKLAEELSELSTAAAASDETEIADALVDLVYVALVTAVKRGHPVISLWNSVHASNMTRTPKGDFTASKGADFKPNDVTQIMHEAGF